ncbi:MAG TPA: septation protein IspZ [Rhizomicrobium sp.]
MMNLLKAFKPLAADFLSTIIFIVVLEITDNVVLSTGVGIATGVIQFLWYWYRGQKIEIMQWASLALVIVLGSATIYTQDAHFMMIKPSIGAFAIAGVMLKRGWQNRYLPPIVQEHTSPGFLIMWGYLWSALYFVLGAANLYVAFKYGRHAWETFTAFVPTIAPLVLFAIQYSSIRVAVHRKLAGLAQPPAPAE